MGLLNRLRSLRQSPAAIEKPRIPLEGYVDGLSCHHVAGWLSDPARPGATLRYTVMLRGTDFTPFSRACCARRSAPG
jgi:hypothetical protein